MFQSRAEKLNEKAFEIFEALDHDCSDSCGYFKQKCSEVPQDVLVTLRDTRAGNEGRTLLHNAARAGKLAAVLFLIRAGHQLEPIDSGVSKITPLMDAIVAEQVEIAVVLVESGASITKTDVNDENALHYAARVGSTRMVKFLIKAAGLSPEETQSCASSTNVKLKFPEDVAKNELTREMLVNYREQGTHASLIRPRSSTSRRAIASR